MIKNMSLDDFQSKVIQQYLLLEKDFISTLNYVSLDKNNYNTFSNKYLKLLLSIGSEIGFLMNELANFYEGNKKDRNFPQCYAVIKTKSNYKLHKIQIGFRESRFSHLPSFKPWLVINNNNNNNKSWWYYYNKIKHCRLEKESNTNKSKPYYKFATLKNVLYSLGALSSLEFIAFREIHHKNKMGSHPPFVPLVKTFFIMKNLGWEKYEYRENCIVVAEENGFCNLDDW